MTLVAVARTELQQLAVSVVEALPVVTAKCETSLGSAAVYATIGALVQRRCTQLIRESARKRSAPLTPAFVHLLTYPSARYLPRRFAALHVPHD